MIDLIMQNSLHDHLPLHVMNWYNKTDTFSDINI